MSSFQEAIEFFSRYGGVTHDTEKLKQELLNTPVAKIKAAAITAQVLHHRSKDEVDRHLIALIWGDS